MAAPSLLLKTAGFRTPEGLSPLSFSLLNGGDQPESCQALDDTEIATRAQTVKARPRDQAPQESEVPDTLLIRDAVALLTHGMECHHNLPH
jgi:hypothetical protein